MKHDFHFVLRKELKDKISNFADIKGMKLSETVVYIFNFMKPVLEKQYLKELICKEGRYTIINAQVDMHIYFEKFNYKYLKQVQSNLYCFSMALVLRWILETFFKGIKNYGFERFCRVVRRFGVFFLDNRKSDVKSISNFIEKKRHMFASCHDFKKIIHIFDNNYDLITTKFT